MTALQAAVAAEDAIVYGYGVAGAHFSGADRRLALALLDAHLRRRDDLSALVRAAGQTPPAAAPAYRLPFPVHDATSARRLAAMLEDSAAGAAWDVVVAGAADGPARRLGVSWLAAAATQAAHWRGLSPGAEPALPGQPP